MIIDESEYLAHYGTLRKSGRYPWGSGDSQSTRNKDFLSYVADMQRQGLSPVEIARGVGMSTTKLRALQSIAKNEEKAADIAMAQRLHNKGMSNKAIGERMMKDGRPRNESSIRALLADGEKEKADSLQTIASMLKDEVAAKRYVDVGSGTEAHLGISATKLNTAVEILKEQGYQVHPLNVNQLGTGLDTRMKVLVPPGVTQKEAWENRTQVRTISNFSNDRGKTFSEIQEPIKIDPKRVAVRYKDEGGGKLDGVIYVRPGVEDISLGKARYAQVRVAVGNDHYLKGMAMYKDDLPKGTDLLFNSPKDDTGNKLDAMKAHSDEPNKPFISSVRRQIIKEDANGNKQVTSAMNIVYEEGNWSKWNDSIASQVLSKQEPKLAREQLNLTYESRKKDFNEIVGLTNPTVRRKLLEEFADSTDSASVHLQAAGMPRQGWHVILPIDSMPPTQIYAPRFFDGERVVLIRYPHGGTFEIPELVVNNNHPEAKRLLGPSPRDAVGVHHTVAQRLSGADFDGDSVLVIPNNLNKITVKPALEGLKNFDPVREYPHYEGMKRMSNTQNEMGSISNLITDMTIRGASTTDLAAAIRHSMVVIDAEKHYLNYKLSAEVNGIKKLKAKYQSQPGGGTGASTLISRAESKVFVPDRKARTASKGGPIDPVTGQKQFEPTGKINYKTGKPKLTKSTRLAETNDAFTLVSSPSSTRIENLYAEHSNRLKSLANQARLEMIKTPRLKYSPSANKVHKQHVDKLNADLALAVRNRPLERQAQVLGNANARARRDANPQMDDKTYKKIRFQALEEARNRTGAKKQKIVIDQDQWNAIQEGAISNSRLNTILNNADMDVVRQLATPRRVNLMTDAKVSAAKGLFDRGYTRAEVANRLGVSLTTLDKATDVSASG